VQILLEGMGNDAAVTVKSSGNLGDLPLEVYELIPVHVEKNVFLKKGKVVNGCPSRWAPFDIYDALKPPEAETTLNPVNGTAALYIAFTTPRGCTPGKRGGTVDITCGGEKISVPAEVMVHKAEIPPEEHLKIVNGYESRITAKYHGVEPDSPECRRLDNAYLNMLRRLHQNTLYSSGIMKTRDTEGRYTFDFTGLERFIENAIRLGYKYFILPSIGWRKSWRKSTILLGGENLPAMSYEGYVYLTQYLSALRAFLAKKDWFNCTFQNVADEPNKHNAIEYRALCGTIRKLAPELRLLEAVSYPVFGALDVWIPLNSDYEKHREAYETFRAEGDELWHYVCCQPRRDGYINRFMDYPLLATRYLFWGNYKYGLSGYLHWASNGYQPGQDPFKQNCPKHTNTDSSIILPAGDTHILYPGKDAPWSSMRFEAQRNSIEDFELLRMLSLKDKAKADAICAKCFRKFNDVEYNLAALDKALAELYTAVSEL
jgi:hypothetical protein